MTAILASEPSSIGQVLDQAFRLFRIGVRGLLPYTIAAAVVTLAMQWMQFRMLGRAPGLGAPVAAPTLSPGYGLILLVVVFLFLIIQLAALHRLAGLDAGTGSNSDSWRAGRSRILAFIGAAILLGLLFAVVFMIIAVPVGGLVASGRGLSGATVVIVAAAVLAAIYFVVRLMYFMPEVVLRNAGPVESLRNSWRITRGHFWRITILLTVLVLATLAVYAIFMFVAGAVLGVVGGTGHMTLNSTVLITDVITAFMVLLTLPLSVGTTLAIWHDLRLRAEGTDLAARIDALPPGR
jgi:Membrane domain of glycerophosphoryl diester phosphodiesterase